MRGYHNKPEATRKALDEEGYMHTGDIGVMDEEGYVRIVDRAKDMIIVGGFKVFSSKVEDVISAHPAIAMMALIGEDNPEKPGSEIVKAYIQIDPNHEFDGDREALTRDILAFAREKCAPYEVPKIVEHLEEAPHIAESMKPEEAFLVAARREKASHEFYLALSKVHSPGPIKDLLERMANEELHHKEKVEYLYSNTAFPQTAGG